MHWHSPESRVFLKLAPYVPCWPLPALLHDPELAMNGPCRHWGSAGHPTLPPQPQPAATAFQTKEGGGSLAGLEKGPQRLSVHPGL